MKMYTLVIVLILPLNSLLSEEISENRIEELISKSAKTRNKVESKSNSKPRDPASIDISYKEFDQLMNANTSDNWLEKVEELTK